MLITFLVLLMAGAGLWYWTTKSEPRQERYKTQPIDRGDIVQNISANGTLNPVVLVNVGTQVSGTVYKLFADFNDEVKEGQILVELDPSLFEAQLRQSEASVLNARVALKVAENKMARNVALKEQGFISPDALDVITQQLEVARARVCGEYGAACARPDQLQLHHYPLTHFRGSHRTQCRHRPDCRSKLSDPYLVSDRQGFAPDADRHQRGGGGYRPPASRPDRKLQCGCLPRP